MREFVPLYETLYDNEKLGLSHVARSVYGGLCVKARKDKGDRVRLPRGEQDLAQGVWRLVGGKLEEVQAALPELQDEQDPMIRVEGSPGRFAVTLLAQSRWALQGREEPEGEHAADDEAQAEDGRSGAARRQARYRARRGGSVTITRNADRNDPHNATHNGERNGTRNADRNAVGGKGGSLVEASEKEEKRREEVAGARDDADRNDPHNATHNGERNGTRNAGDGNPRFRPTSPGDGRPGLVATLRSHPELAEYERVGMLKLEDCAANLKRVADKFTGTGKVRPEDVRERLEWAISEVAREVRSANQTSNPWPEQKVAKKLETFAHTNLGRSREQWDADRGLREGRPSRPGEAPPRPAPTVATPESIARLTAAKRDE